VSKRVNGNTGQKVIREGTCICHYNYTLWKK
jgi:hypothetical protein